MSLRKLIFPGLFSLLLLSESHAVSISGEVRDNATGLPIEGARVEALKVETFTDAQGAFILTLADSVVSKRPLVLQVGEHRYFTKKVMNPSVASEKQVILLQPAKQRLIVTTDIGGADPDDEQSLVHLLVCSNDVQLEGLICGVAWQDRVQGVDILNAIIGDYGRIEGNLKIHAEGYPTMEYLRSIAKSGQPKAGMKGVGAGHDSPGSKLIIQAVDRDDPRPVWVNAWGGNNTLAQALWKVMTTRSPAEVARFVHKLRVFDILGQDDAGAWMVTTFPNLVYIRSKEVYGWAPDDEWVARFVQSQAPFGLRYRSRVWAVEGDSPAFMHVLSNGLNDPNQIDQGGWGGRFLRESRTNIRSMGFVAESGLDEMRFAPYKMLSDSAEGVGAIKRWSPAIFNDLRARMQWSATSAFKEANHHPQAILNGDDTRQVLDFSVQGGEEVSLDASSSVDPDGDQLAYSWKYYKEAGSYTGDLVLKESSLSVVRFRVPEKASGASIHLVLEVSDSGTPSLSAFRRVILHVK